MLRCSTKSKSSAGRPFGHNRHGLKSVRAAVPFWGEKLGPHLTQRRMAYIRTKWHLDRSNRLATIHQRYRQDRQTGKSTVS